MELDDSHPSAIDDATPRAASVEMPRLCANRSSGQRTVAEECPVALVYDGTTFAVLMATPADLTELAFGFSVTEGIVCDIGDISELNIIHSTDGIELRMWLRRDRARLLKARRRRLVGPTGCGLCGIESLEDANRVPAPVLRGISLTSGQVTEAVAALTAAQEFNRQTRATHAAGFFLPDTGNISSARTSVATTRWTSSRARSQPAASPVDQAPSF